MSDTEDIAGVISRSLGSPIKECKTYSLHFEGRGLHYGHLVLNGALHYVWLRLRYVSITFESTLQIPAKRGPVIDKYGTDL